MQKDLSYFNAKKDRVQNVRKKTGILQKKTRLEDVDDGCHTSSNRETSSEKDSSIKD